MSKDKTIIEGVGNVFDDLGMPDAAAELVKAQLTFQIAKRIKALSLTQTAAAARLGVSQPDVSRPMKRRPTGFSTERLLALLTALDIDVDIVLRPASAPAWRRGSLLKRIQRGDADIRPALINEVKARTAGASVPRVLTGLDCKVFTRTKVEPMAGASSRSSSSRRCSTCSLAPSSFSPKYYRGGAEKGLSQYGLEPR